MTSIHFKREMGRKRVLPGIREVRLGGVAEVGLEGKFSIKVFESGTATRTNHFLDPMLAEMFNGKIGTSSTIRLAHILELLA